MSELKSCPFCGGEAHIVRSNLGERLAWYGVQVNYETSDLYGVECNECPGAVSPMRLTEAEAAAAWNTRHVETCKVEGSYYSELMDVYVFSLSCGDSIWWNDEEPPNYCPDCGRKVER